MERLHPATIGVDALLQQCVFRRSRRKGPGGQHRNKVETAVTVVHTPTDIRGDASERRSQAQNRDVAIRRLRVNLALQIRAPRADGAAASKLWRARVNNGQLSINASHADFPALLAEALDVLAAHSMDTQASSHALDVSHSQFVKFLTLEPRAIMAVNRHRLELGLRPLK